MTPAEEGIQAVREDARNASKKKAYIVKSYDTVRFEHMYTLKLSTGSELISSSIKDIFRQVEANDIRNIEYIITE